MSNSLDEQIKKQADILDNAIPPIGHFERFEQRLEQHEKRKTLHARRWVTVTAVAATVAILLMIQYTHPLQQMPPSHDTVPEVTAYYNSQLREEIHKIEYKARYIDKKERIEIIKDMQGMLKESETKDSSLSKMTAEERIAFIVMRYNAQLRSLQHIQSLLEEIPNRNTLKL